MPPRPSFPTFDRILGGTLAERLRKLRADGSSFNEIAFRLRVENGIDVSPETVRRWLRNVDDVA